MPQVIEDALLIVQTPAGLAVNVPTTAGIKVGPGVTLADYLDELEARPAPVPALATQTRAGVAKGSDTVIVDAEGGLHAVGVGDSIGAGGAFVGQWLYLRQTPLPPGYIELNGVLYKNAADKFPELLVYLATHQDELTTETDWQARSAAASGIGGVPFYVHDAVENTLRMPDTREDSPYHGTAGAWEGDAIRNIKGHFSPGVRNDSYTGIFSAYGCFYVNATPINYRFIVGTNKTMVGNHYAFFDTSKVVPTATTNHPRRVGMTLAVYAGIIGA